MSTRIKLKIRILKIKQFKQASIFRQLTVVSKTIYGNWETLKAELYSTLILYPNKLFNSYLTLSTRRHVTFKYFPKNDSPSLSLDNEVHIIIATIRKRNKIVMLSYDMMKQLRLDEENVTICLPM